MRPWRAGRSRRQSVRLSTPRLARTAAGEVYGWGRADSSQLGLGSGAEATVARDIPVRVPGLGLANPNPNPSPNPNSKPSPNPSPSPNQVRVPGVSDVRSIACGSNHCCAVTAEADLFTWGLRPNPYPDPYPYPKPKPKPNPYPYPYPYPNPKPKPNPNPRWGFGEMSQLGHGEADDEPSPRLVSAVRGRVAQAGAGGQHTVMLLKPKE